MAELESLNLYEKLAKIRKQVEVLKKNKAGFNYTYVTDEEILAKVTVLMDKYNISLIPEVVPGTLTHETYHYTKTRKTKAGELYEEHNNEIIVSMDMTYTWVNNLNPEERIVVPWFAIGQQADSSQAAGSSLTYSLRYFLLKYFNIATPEDDVDNWRSKQRAAEAAEEKTVAQEIIKNFDALVKDYLADNPKDEAKVKTLVGKYVKNGNYFAIQSSALASKLLTDFKNNFIKEES